MKKKERDGHRPAAVRFNIWLMLVCFLLAVCIWAAILYIGASAGEKESLSLPGPDVCAAEAAWHF